MKSLIDRFFNHTSHFEFFLLFVPFILWVYCFLNFFTGHLPLYEDATSYADHIIIYTNNLCKGVYPLWDPAWFSGAPNDFFLRRIGDVNPLLFVIVFLKWIGVSSAYAYLIFLGVYYFLAAWAFYLIARHLLVDRFYAFIAYVLFLFSSWGSEIFYNYIIIIFVPIIWFFYFLLSFGKNPQKGYFLGMCLCLGVIITTYIPFFFLTILAIFTGLFIIFYGKDFFGFLKSGLSFLFQHKAFTIFCLCFLLLSSIPGIIFYKESKSGDFALPNRHSGADTSSAVAVGIQNVASGDIISHGYFDRIFDDHQHLDMGDIYIPYIFFIILLVTVFARINKLIFFLLFNILALSLITITTAGGIHRFLYEHIIIFKFIRNIYYFFWLAMLPMALLLAVSAFKSLLTTINTSSKRWGWFILVLMSHLIFILFLCKHPDVLVGAWAAVFISLIYFLIYFFMENKISYFAGFCLLLLAIFIQSVQVYQCLDQKLYLNKITVARQAQTQVATKKQRLDLYYATSWFALLVNYIDPQVLDDYRAHPYILYDNVLPYLDGPEFFKSLEQTIANNTNVAFIPRSESGPNDWNKSSESSLHADNDPVASKKISVLHQDTNTWVLNAQLPDKQFLVINDNYNRDWHAYINGHQIRLFRTNFSFKGLWVPSGNSTIVLRFSTPKRYFFHFFLMAFFVFNFLYLFILLRRKKPQGAYE